MNRHVNAIAGRLSLRAPQRRSLEILDRLTTHHSPLTTHHLPLTTYHLPLTTYHLPLTTYHLPLTTYRPLDSVKVTK